VLAGIVTVNELEQDLTEPKSSTAIEALDAVAS
jgi:hypothetical protein